MVRSLVGLAMVIGLGVEARADKVDWSQYIEKPGDHVVNKSAAASQPKPAKVAKAPTKSHAAPAKKAAKRLPAKKH